MKRFIALSLIAALYSFAASGLEYKRFSFGTNNYAGMSASSGVVITNGPLIGFVESVIIKASNTYAYESSGTLKPDAVRYFVYNDTFNDSNAYLSVDGIYQIRYETNGMYMLSTVESGAYDGPAWTNFSGGVDGAIAGTNYWPVGDTATGLLVVAATAADVDIDVATLGNDEAGPSRTLFSADDVAANATYPVRIPCTSTAGGATSTVCRIPLIGQYVTVSAYDAAESNTVVEVWVVITDEEE